MAGKKEHYIPIRVTELVNLLASEKNPVTGRSLEGVEEAQFRKFARILMATYHHDYHTQLMRMKNAYAPFDPDAETKPLVSFSAEEKKDRQNKFIDDFGALLGQANYIRMDRDQMNAVMQGASEWGLDMEVDWSVFERLEIYYRGDLTTTRKRSKFFGLLGTEEVRYPAFQRLVVIVKHSKNAGLGPDADTDGVYIKLFKNMPKNDLEMVLPGTKIKLTKLDKAMIFYPIVMAVGLLLFKILDDALGLNTGISAGAALAVSWALFAMLGGKAYQSYYSYTIKKQSYTLQLTQNLYYQNLDNNAGVIHRLLDEAEEQDIREALLAYYYLWRSEGTGLTANNLDAGIELMLEKIVKREVDFEVDDALRKLLKHGLVTESGGHYTAIPIQEAIDKLDHEWDTLFSGTSESTVGDLAFTHG